MVTLPAGTTAGATDVPPTHELHVRGRARGRRTLPRPRHSRGDRRPGRCFGRNAPRCLRYYTDRCFLGKGSGRTTRRIEAERLVFAVAVLARVPNTAPRREFAQSDRQRADGY